MYQKRRAYGRFGPFLQSLANIGQYRQHWQDLARGRDATATCQAPGLKLDNIRQNSPKLAKPNQVLELSSKRSALGPAPLFLN